MKQKTTLVRPKGSYNCNNGGNEARKTHWYLHKQLQCNKGKGVKEESDNKRS
ncbi:hypothetical protein KSS87_004295 [Heliosperma pusillum]|nr:hypothetical protein KSS87_004295 [Heliosperma pusillum]